MATPIEPTPVLDAEEWREFLKTVEMMATRPFKKHSVNIEEIKAISRRIEEKKANVTVGK